MLDAANRAMVDTAVRQADMVAEPSSLPAEVFADPADLVEELTQLAEMHGYEPDRDDSTRPALIATARMLLQVLLPRRACIDCRYDVDNHPRCSVPNCSCWCTHPDTPEDMLHRPSRIGS